MKGQCESAAGRGAVAGEQRAWGGVQSAAKLEQKGLQAGDVVIVDITASDAKEKLRAALAGADALVIGTSGSPQVS